MDLSQIREIGQYCVFNLSADLMVLTKLGRETKLSANLHFFKYSKRKLNFYYCYYCSVASNTGILIKYSNHF